MASPRDGVRFSPNHHPQVRTIAIGQTKALHEDLYHWVLNLRWHRLFLLIAGIFLLTNTLFALAFLAVPGSIVNATPGSFEDAFYFSVQTFATIGYGVMTPANRYGHLLVTLEALWGLVSTALMTGITFAKFARPTARVLFARSAVIARRNGRPYLLFRLANFRGNMVVEAQMRATILLKETTQEGETLWVPTELKLLRDRTPMFTLTWLVMHPIDEASPFHGPDTLARLARERAEIFLSFSGVDDTFAQSVHARYRYKMEDIVPDARFKDVLSIQEDGTRVIDYTHFHSIVPAQVKPSES